MPRPQLLKQVAVQSKKHITSGLLFFHGAETFLHKTVADGCTEPRMVVYPYQCILMKYEQNGIHWAHRCHEYNPTVLNHEKTRFIVHASSEGHGPTKGWFFDIVYAYGLIWMCILPSEWSGNDLTSSHVGCTKNTLGKY